MCCVAYPSTQRQPSTRGAARHHEGTMMSEQRFFDHGTPGWVDLGTSDPVAARLFYGVLFGWEADDQGRGYALCRLHGRAVAGIGPLSVAGQHSAWMTYMIVDDADSSVARVKAAGGEVFLGPLD